MASSWVHGPDRGLHPVAKDEDAPLPPDTTFNPELMSNPQLREKARSSGYGSVVPKVEKVVLEPNDLRPWEEPPTFRPALPESELRAKASSSNYGVAIPQRKELQAPSPSFQPEPITAKSKVSAEWTGKARSSKYGQETAKVSPPPPPPKHTFTPELPKSSSREKYSSTVTSSKYGHVLPATPERPSTAPSREVSAEDVLSKRPQTAGARSKEPEQPFVDPLDERAKDGGFVLDGVHVGLCLRAQQEYNGTYRRHSLLGQPKQLVGAEELRRAALEKAVSSKYGLVSPARGERPAEKKGEPRLAFDRRSTLHTPIEPFTEKSALNEKVRSNAYGVQSPAKVERPPSREPEPRWAPSLVAAKTEPPPTPRSALNDKVSSHSYGQVAPEKGEKKEVVLEPVWVPSSARGGIPEPEPPRPRSAQYSNVRSHYGSDYNPSANASAVAEDAY